MEAAASQRSNRDARCIDHVGAVFNFSIAHSTLMHDGLPNGDYSQLTTFVFAPISFYTQIVVASALCKLSCAVTTV